MSRRSRNIIREKKDYIPSHYIEWETDIAREGRRRKEIGREGVGACKRGQRKEEEVGCEGEGKERRQRNLKFAVGN